MLEKAVPAVRWWYEKGIPETIIQGLRGRLLYAETTPYQRLEILEHDHLGRVLVLDGLIQTTLADEFVYHEMLVQVPLLGRRGPGGSAAIIIIGGGDGGCLREALRHSWVKRVVMVELDEIVVRRSVEYLGIHGDYDDPRLELVIGDGAAYMRSAARGGERFDAVIIDSTDPIGPGRSLYRRDFYGDIKSCLAPNGVVCQHLGVPAYQDDVLERGARRMREVFGNVQVYRASIPTYIGGDMAFALATEGYHSYDNPAIEFTGRYYNSAVHTAAFALPTWWREKIEQ
ncbi:MAG: polyamine aminopropyltransferase [Blastocatellia bacterium]|nr:polyamine aminopropyltransferase [Blastocatellia bacterium]